MAPAEIAAAIPGVMQKYPELGQYGLNTPRDERPNQRGIPGQFDLESVAKAVRWIETAGLIPKTRAIKWRSSYGLKHSYEQYCRDRGYNDYLANGDMIVAAIICGLKVKPFEHPGPNVHIAISRRAARAGANETSERG